MIRYQIMLAVQEICVNIIEHAYAHGPGLIGVAVSGGFDPAQIEITLHDSGRPFDPAAVAEPKLDDPQKGGLGLFIVKHQMDRVVYRADTRGNEWHMMKYL